MTGKQWIYNQNKDKFSIHREMTYRSGVAPPIARVQHTKRNKQSEDFEATCLFWSETVNNWHFRWCAFAVRCFKSSKRWMKTRRKIELCISKMFLFEFSCFSLLSSEMMQITIDLFLTTPAGWTVHVGKWSATIGTQSSVEEPEFILV